MLHHFPELKGVRFQCSYENVIMPAEQVVSLFIPHMIEIINGKYAAITKTIQTDKYRFDGEKLELFALGRLATEQLNEKVAHQFSGLLASHFDIHAKVVFLNDEEIYSQAAEDWRSSEEADIKASLAEEMKKAAAVKKPGGHKPASGGGGFARKRRRGRLCRKRRPEERRLPQTGEGDPGGGQPDHGQGHHGRIRGPVRLAGGFRHGHRRGYSLQKRRPGHQK